MNRHVWQNSRWQSWTWKCYIKNNCLILSCERIIVRNSTFLLMKFVCHSSWRCNYSICMFRHFLWLNYSSPSFCSSSPNQHQVFTETLTLCVSCMLLWFCLDLVVQVLMQLFLFITSVILCTGHHFSWARALPVVWSLLFLSLHVWFGHVQCLYWQLFQQPPFRSARSGSAWTVDSWHILAV